MINILCLAVLPAMLAPPQGLLPLRTIERVGFDWPSVSEDSGGTRAVSGVPDWARTVTAAAATESIFSLEANEITAFQIREQPGIDHPRTTPEEMRIRQEYEPSTRLVGTGLELGVVALGGDGFSGFSGLELNWLGLGLFESPKEGAYLYEDGIGIRHRFADDGGTHTSLVLITENRWSTDLTATRWDPFWVLTFGLGLLEVGLQRAADMDPKPGVGETFVTVDFSAGLGVSYWVFDDWSVYAKADFTLGAALGLAIYGEYAVTLGGGYSF